MAIAPARADAQPSVAKPSVADKETARQLFDNGVQKLEAKDYDGAIKAFKAAHDIMNVPTTGYRLAQAQDAGGLLIEARYTALSVARIPADPLDPTAFTNARVEAATLGDSLLARIPSLVISVKGLPAGVVPTVTVEGVAVPVSTLGLPRSVNPGSYTVTASASGYTTARVIAMVKQKEQLLVPLNMTPAPAASPSTAPPPVSAAPAGPPDAAPSAVSSTPAAPMSASPPTASPAGSPSTAPAKSAAAMDLPPITPPPAKPGGSKSSIFAMTVQPELPAEPAWYGWQNLISLGLSSAIAVPAGLASIPSEGASTGWYVMAALGGSSLALGGPIVHWSHGNVSQGFKALALNLGLTGGLGGLGYGITHSLEPDGSSDMAGVGIGAGVGFFIATVVDVAALSYEKPKDAAALRGQNPVVGLAPVIDVQEERSVFGLAGRFH